MSVASGVHEFGGIGLPVLLASLIWRRRAANLSPLGPCGQEVATFSPQYAPSDQISDVKKAIIAGSRGQIVGGGGVLRGKVTGKVAAIGGSAGGAHAAWCAATGTNNHDTLDAAVFLSGEYKFDDEMSFEDTDSEFCRKVKDYCMVLEHTCDFDVLSDDGRQRLQLGSPLYNMTSAEGVCPIYAFDTTQDPAPKWQLEALKHQLNNILADFEALRFAPTVGGDVHSFSYWFDETIPNDPNSKVNKLAKDFLHDRLDAP